MVSGQRLGGAMHPGAVIRQKCLDPNKLSVTEAARILGVDRQTLSNLLNGRSGLSPEMAIRLEKAFGSTARQWLIYQLDFELAEVMKRAESIVVEPFCASSTERQGE
jgi:addiction module HigA family antidote